MIKRIGIMGAMTEEIRRLIAELDSDTVIEEGMRTYHLGHLWGTAVVLVVSRIGKVAAAATATHLIAKLGVQEILFTGVGASSTLAVGDIVVGTRLYQHDMDARPLFDRYEIPLLGVRSFATQPERTEDLLKAAQNYIAGKFHEEISSADREEFHLTRPRVVSGEIASGDKFFANKSELDELGARLPNVLCAEMEGAAVAQICHEYGIPFSIIRTISDSGDENAHLNFPKFIETVASIYSHGIVREFLQNQRASSPKI